MPDFAALLSLFNIIGRIGWASASDYIGRKRTYMIFFALGGLLYATAPFAGRIGSVPLFVALFCLILTMYGGGFATIPAYLADLFGTSSSAPFTVVSLPHGPRRGFWARRWSPTSGSTSWRMACRARRPTTSPCTSWPACFWPDLPATSRFAPSPTASTCPTPSWSASARRHRHQAELPGHLLGLHKIAVSRILFHPVTCSPEVIWPTPIRRHRPRAVGLW